MTFPQSCKCWHKVLKSTKISEIVQEGLYAEPFQAVFNPTNSCTEQKWKHRVHELNCDCHRMCSGLDLQEAGCKYVLHPQRYSTFQSALQEQQ